MMEWVKIFFNKAIEWFKKAAEHGYAEAQNNLGVIYYNGDGLDKDLTKAIEWYTKAYDQEYAGTQRALDILKNIVCR